MEFKVGELYKFEDVLIGMQQGVTDAADGLKAWTDGVRASGGLTAESIEAGHDAARRVCEAATGFNEHWFKLTGKSFTWRQLA